jgi:hypothetical protein
VIWFRIHTSDHCFRIWILQAKKHPDPADLDALQEKLVLGILNRILVCMIRMFVQSQIRIQVH